MFELPTTITVCGNEYPIRNNGDFRMVFDCFKALTDDELDISYRIITALIIFIEGFDDMGDVSAAFPTEESLNEAVKQMYLWFNCGQEEASGVHTHKGVVDWEQDQQLIAGAINAVSHVEIRSLSYLHWWTFMGYYYNIGEGAFSTIVSIRSKIKEGKKLEKHEQDFRRNNPQYFTTKRTAVEKDFDEELRRMWE